MKELCRSQYFTFYVSADTFSRWKLSIDFGEDFVDLSFCDFLSLKRTLDNIDMMPHFEVDNAGIEIITIRNKQHVLVLDTAELISLKQLVENTISAINITS